MSDDDSIKISLKFAIITLFSHFFFFFQFYSGRLFNVYDIEQALLAKFNLCVLIAV